MLLVGGRNRDKNEINYSEKRSKKWYKSKASEEEEEATEFSTVEEVE